MKKLLAFLLVCAAFGLGLTGCVAYKPAIYTTDYTVYNNNGFFVSPFDNVEGCSFVPLCTLVIENKESNTTASALFDDLVSAAKQHGATGLINVKIRRETISTGKIITYVLRAEGVAIKFSGKSPLE